MTAPLIGIVLMAMVLAGAWGMLAAGYRAGDRPGQAVLDDFGPDASGEGLRFTVHNPGRQPVLLGATVRRRTVRSWCEGGYFVRVPRRTWQERLRASRHTVVCVVEPEATEAVRVPVGVAAGRRRAELVVAIGESDRLRLIHRAVALRQEPRAPQPATRGRRCARQPVASLRIDRAATRRR